MDENKKKKIIIWVSVATILGVGGYFAYNWFRNRPKKDEGNKDQTTVYDPQPSGGESSNGPTNEQIELAKAYRVWANSTDALSKKYGKKTTCYSKYTYSNERLV